MLFGCIYRSPTTSATSDKNNEDLNRVFQNIANKRYSHKCVVGYFNLRDINWTNWTTNHNEVSKEHLFIDMRAALVICH